MDFFDESPLNKAHFFCRKADRLAEFGNLEEASECHGKAADLLFEALSLTTNQLAIESIDLQYQYHLKKQEILRLKKLHCEAVKEADRIRKEVMSRVLKVNKKTESVDGDSNLQKAIYRTFDEADSLLDILVNRKEEDGCEKSGCTPAEVVSGYKRPKNDSTVIEELKIVNCQLRSLISELMTSLAASERQVSVLKARIAELESSPSKYPKESSNALGGSRNLAAGSETPPPEDTPLEFPPLAPLELPDFD